MWEVTSVHPNFNQCSLTIASLNTKPKLTLQFTTLMHLKAVNPGSDYGIGTV